MMTVMIMVMMAIMMSLKVFEDDFGDNICEDSSIMTMMVFKMMLFGKNVLEDLLIMMQMMIM